MDDTNYVEHKHFYREAAEFAASQYKKYLDATEHKNMLAAEKYLTKWKDVNSMLAQKAQDLGELYLFPERPGNDDGI